MKQQLFTYSINGEVQDITTGTLTDIMKEVLECMAYKRDRDIKVIETTQGNRYEIMTTEASD